MGKTSPRFSFKGYDIKTAIYNNKDSIKALLAIFVGVNSYSGFDWKTASFTFLAGAGVLAGKLVMDAVDYFFTVVEI